MAKKQSGKKKVHVPAHRRSDGTKVREHYRLTPNLKLKPLTLGAFLIPEIKLHKKNKNKPNNFNRIEVNFYE